MVVRLRSDGAFEATSHGQLKKGDVFVQVEGDGPKAWVAIADNDPVNGLRCEPLDCLARHIVDPVPVS